MPRSSSAQQRRLKSPIRLARSRPPFHDAIADVVEPAQEPVSAVASNGRAIYCNQAFADLVGLSKRDVLRRSAPFPWWPPEVVPLLIPAFRSVLQAIREAGVLSFPEELHRPDGQVVTTTGTARRLVGTTGRDIGVLVSYSNVRLVRSQQRMEAALGRIAAELDALGTRQADSTRRDLPRALLSRREQEVAQQLLRGASVSMIATRLHLRPKTVRNHLASVMNKLGIHSQVQLVARFRD